MRCARCTPRSTAKRNGLQRSTVIGCDAVEAARRVVSTICQSRKSRRRASVRRIRSCCVRAKRGRRALARSSMARGHVASTRIVRRSAARRVCRSACSTKTATRSSSGATSVRSMSKAGRLSRPSTRRRAGWWGPASSAWPRSTRGTRQRRVAGGTATSGSRCDPSSRTARRGRPGSRRAGRLVRGSARRGDDLESLDPRLRELIYARQTPHRDDRFRAIRESPCPARRRAARRSGRASQRRACGS